MDMSPYIHTHDVVNNEALGRLSMVLTEYLGVTLNVRVISPWVRRWMGLICWSNAL